MVLDFTDSENTASPRAGVNALLGNAGHASRTVCVLQALSSAALCRDGVTLEAPPTAANNFPRPVFITLSIGSAWGRVARVLRNTTLEWISPEARVTPTVLIATVCDQTFCIFSTGSWLTEGNHWLNSLDRDAALDCVDSFCEAWCTGTPLDVVHNNTFCVGATWVGLALLHWLHAGDCRRVALKSGQAVANWTVRNHPAARVGSTLVSTAAFTIGYAADEWVSCLTPRAGADRVSVVQLADGSDSTGRGHTRVARLLDETATDIWITVEAGLAGADGVVVGEAAVGVGTTELAAAHRKTLPAESVAILVLRAVRVDEAFFVLTRLALSVVVHKLPRLTFNALNLRIPLTLTIDARLSPGAAHCLTFTGWNIDAFCEMV